MRRPSEKTRKVDLHPMGWTLNTLAQRTSLALIAAAGGWMLTGCVKTADFFDAALMTPVLIEDFEAPVIQNAVAYNAGQSFQTATNTWEVTAGGIEIFNAKDRPETTAFDGNQAVQLTGATGAGGLAISFATIQKKQYTLTFHYAHNNLLGTNANRARVEVLSASTTLLEARFSHESVPFDSYRRYSGIFTADSARTTLRFTSLTPGRYGITLDGISVRTVPPPPPTPPRVQ